MQNTKLVMPYCYNRFAWRIAIRHHLNSYWETQLARRSSTLTLFSLSVFSRHPRWNGSNMRWRSRDSLSHCIQGESALMRHVDLCSCIYPWFPFPIQRFSHIFALFELRVDCLMLIYGDSSIQRVSTIYRPRAADYRNLQARSLYKLFSPVIIIKMFRARNVFYSRQVSWLRNPGEKTYDVTVVIFTGKPQELIDAVQFISVQPWQ
jgi:hypothetical protein